MIIEPTCLCLQNSNRIICSAVFGFDEKMQVRSSLRFHQNNLVISSVDIQSVEPVDQRTRDALQKSVQLAIEITTNSQEAAARSDTHTRTRTHTVSMRRRSFMRFACVQTRG